MTYGVNLARIYVKNELVKSGKYEHLANIRKQTGLDYQLINLENGGYKLEVQAKK